MNRSLQQAVRQQEQHLIRIKREEFVVEELAFIESKKNYLHLISSNDKISSVRMTMKEMEAKLGSYPQLVRCHRAFMVNLDQLAKVEGNAQGLRLHLRNSATYVPVSRSYIPKI